MKKRRRKPSSTEDYRRKALLAQHRRRTMALIDPQVEALLSNGVTVFFENGQVFVRPTVVVPDRDRARIDNVGRLLEAGFMYAAWMHDLDVTNEELLQHVAYVQALVPVVIPEVPAPAVNPPRTTEEKPSSPSTDAV